jgi:hypothetical protein
MIKTMPVCYRLFLIFFLELGSPLRSSASDLTRRALLTSRAVAEYSALARRAFIAARSMAAWPALTRRALLESC